MFMIVRTLSALGLAAIILSGLASAQVPKGLDPLTEGQRNLAADSTDNHRFQDGIAALQAKNFPVAEAVFADVLLRDQNNADANFYMGVTKMSLGKWEEAKKYLEIAAKKTPKNPDPKSRLGVTYAKLGDTEGANGQRAELAKMSEACKGACKLAPYIMDGIQMIDSALQAGPVPKPAP
jgi:TolA-binding protein